VTSARSTDPRTAEAQAAEDLRLARLHLRLGMLDQARAELEDLGRRAALSREGLAALAEARWRGGDLEAAAEAAQRHLDGGGDDPIAIVVAAEAAAAAGRPAEAQALVERAGAIDAAALEAIFAGLPRRAYWPAAAAAGAGKAAAPAGRGSAEVRAAERVAGPPVEPSRTVPGPSDVLAASGGLWDAPPEAGTAAATTRPARRAAAPAWAEPARPKAHADPGADLAVARAELAEAPERGLLRLALILRLDPTLAPEVLDAVRLRREPAALVLRGDAQRLLGRHLEAEAEFAEATESIEREAIASARRSGRRPTTEEP
jgi:hypothetical protein